MTTNGSYKPSKATMKAQQYDTASNKLQLNDVPIPTPAPHQILVKIACASLCHSDVMLFEPNDQGLILGDGRPITVGHEATGWIAGMGSDVKGFKEGDAVGFLPPADCCFECEPCVKTHNLWCEKGTQMHGFGVDGFFAEYTVVDQRCAMVLPAELDPKTAAPLFCAGVTAFHGVDDCHLKPGQWMAIIGTGGLGHLGVQYAKAMGLKVIGLDISDPQLETAKAGGADYVFNTKTYSDYKTKILEITGGGVDAAVNFTAAKRSYDDAPAIIRPGLGILMVVGIPQQPLTLNALDIAMGRYRILGSNNGTPINMHAAIDFSAKHNIKPHLTLHKLEDLPKMMDQMHAGNTQGRLGVSFV